MARARNIKPGFFKNEFLADMPCEARLLFIGLWTLADREGRLEDRPKRIKAELFAFDSFDVDSMLNLLQRDKFVLRYEAGGVRFIQIENFVKHQDPHYKEKASEIPAPEGRDNLIIASGVTRTQRARIFERDSYTCQSCGSKEHLCIDHILPVSRGGDSSDENLQTLCLSCNTTKGNKLDGEEKNSRQRRNDVESNSNQQSSSLPSDSLIPDSLNLIPDSPIPITDSSKKPAQKRRHEYDEEFIAAWSAYPSRPGANKAQTFKAWSARIEEGVAPDVMIEGAIRYANYCRVSVTSPEYIKQPATFFGPHRHFDSDWSVPQCATTLKSQYQIVQDAQTKAIFGDTSGFMLGEKVISGDVVQ